MRDIVVRLAGAAALCGTALMPVSAQAFDAGGFAGGILGGMIGSAMMGARRPVVVYRPRPVYRVVVPRRMVVVRHYAAVRPVHHVAARPTHHAAAPTASAAVVNPSADPFAAAKPTGPMPIPVANKP